MLLTNAITVKGTAAAPDVDYANFQSALAAGGPACPSITDPTLNALCQLTGAHLGLAQLYAQLAPGFDPANVVASFSFSTESTIDTLAVLASPNLTKPQPFKGKPHRDHDRAGARGPRWSRRCVRARIDDSLLPEQERPADRLVAGATVSAR